MELKHKFSLEFCDCFKQSKAILLPKQAIPSFPGALLADLIENCSFFCWISQAVWLHDCRLTKGAGRIVQAEITGCSTVAFGVSVLRPTFFKSVGNIQH